MIVSKKIQIPILYDTREQNPLDFKTQLAENKDLEIKLQCDTFPCGDYSLVGHDQPGDDNSIMIERKKDAQELIGNLGTRWDQFTTEMEKMQLYKHRMILVCGEKNFDFLYNRGWTKLHPSFIEKRLAECHINYGVPIMFFKNRMAVEFYMIKLFKRILEINKYDG